MQKVILLALALIAGAAVHAQTGSATQVQWTYTAKKIAAGTYEVHLSARIGGNWHLYAQKGGDGPISTSFTFAQNPLLTLSGSVKEVGTEKSVYESAFKSTVHYYEGSVDFVQIVKLKSDVKTALAGKVEFMVCNDKECLPPTDVDFKIPVGS
jgi:DsbC/DsbD-like thiol-disulfide interchange protein